MARRIFRREFKVAAVRLVKERGVTVAQACRALDVHENVAARPPAFDDWLPQPGNLTLRPRNPQQLTPMNHAE